MWKPGSVSKGVGAERLRCRAGVCSSWHQYFRVFLGPTVFWGGGMCLWVLWTPCKVMLYFWSLALPHFLLAATDSVFLSYSTCGPKWPHPSAPDIRAVFTNPVRPLLWAIPSSGKGAWRP